MNFITFTGIKPGPVAFLGFLNLKSHLTIETTQNKKKKVCKTLIGESKDAQALKAPIMVGEVRRCAGVYQWWVTCTGA